MEKLLNLFEKLPRWVWHLLFWTSYLLYNTIQNGYWRRNYENTFYQYVFFMPVIILATYQMIYFLIPRYLEKNRLLQFAGLLLISLFCFTLLQRIMTQYVISPLFYPEAYQRQYQNLSLLQPFYFISHMMSIYSIVTIVIMIKLFKKWSVQKQNSAQLLHEKYDAEIKFLRHQIHPHFLFNVMNSIYGLALKKSPQTPEIILKFSDLLSYMLYECNGKHITIGKEVEMLENYLALEKTRFGRRIKINTHINIANPASPIAPLLFFPFVENAIKHGASADDSEIPIDVSLNSSAGELAFSVVNKKSKYRPPQIPGNHSTSGIGIQNVRRRLELIYPGKFELNCRDSEEKYQVELILKLEKRGQE